MITVRRQSLIALVALLLAAVAFADDYNWAPKQPTGSTFPVFTAIDTNGNELALDEFAGTSGTLLFFNRSTDW